MLYVTNVPFLDIPAIGARFVAVRQSILTLADTLDRGQPDHQWLESALHTVDSLALTLETTAGHADQHAERKAVKLSGELHQVAAVARAAAGRVRPLVLSASTDSAAFRAIYAEVWDQLFPRWKKAIEDFRKAMGEVL